MITLLQEVAETCTKASQASTKIKDSGTLIWDQLAGWYNSFISNLPNICIAIVVLLIAYFASKYIDKGIQRLLQGRVSQASVRRLAGKQSRL